MKVRTAQLTDLELISHFCMQLSSNFNPEVLKESFQGILNDKYAAIFISESGSEASGFIEIHLQQSLQSGRHAMIRALYVSESFRRSGHAKVLIRKAEDWATHHGASKILVQSKVERNAAEKFYLGIGYSKFKVQNIFKKILTI
jgi:GNAT superfamily N-acetyltransferase